MAIDGERYRNIRELKKQLQRLIAEHSLNNVIHELFQSEGWDKLFLSMANFCCFKAESEKDKKTRQQWHQVGRQFHRVRDEIIIPKKPFQITYKDVYQCKCGRKFQVDFVDYKNCKFEIQEGLILIKCPSCGNEESKTG